MNKINYKVIFRGWNDDNNFDLTLTFREIKSEKKYITISPKMLSDLKIISDKNPKIVLFQNIDDVFITGNNSMKLNYINYYVILFKSKIQGKKEAILIGSRKKENDLEILGIWPFNSKKEEITKARILELFNRILTNPDFYENICIITS